VGDGWERLAMDGSFPDGHGLTPPEDWLSRLRFRLCGSVSWRPVSQFGWGPQRKGFCAVTQRFDKGMLVQSTAASGCGDGQFNWATTSSSSRCSSSTTTALEKVLTGCVRQHGEHYTKV
jgi:hypothetical protein